MTFTTALEPLSKTEIETLATQWCHKLDGHTPLVEVLSLVASDGLELNFSESTITSHAELECWYEELIRTFFDEARAVKVVRSKIKADGAEVQVAIHWEASVWIPPAAKTERIKLDALQTWIVVRCPETEKPLLLRCKTDRLDYAKDSARL